MKVRVLPEHAARCSAVTQALRCHRCTLLAGATAVLTAAAWRRRADTVLLVNFPLSFLDWFRVPCFDMNMLQPPLILRCSAEKLERSQPADDYRTMSTISARMSYMLSNRASCQAILRCNSPKRFSLPYALRRRRSRSISITITYDWRAYPVNCLRA